MAEYKYKYSSPATPSEDPNDPAIIRSYQEKVEMKGVPLNKIVKEIESLNNSGIYEEITISVSGKVPKD